MRYKTSIAFDAMSGSAKGVTASRNRSATFLRNKGHAGHVRTADQAAVKSIFRLLTRSWKTLTQQQINQWNQAAVTQAGRRVLGQTARISGANLYLRLNFWVVRCGGTPLPVPPTLGSIEAPSAATVAMSPSSMIFMLDSAPSNPDLRLVILATKPQSNGVVTGVGRGSAFSAPIVLDGTSVNIGPGYVAKYGYPSAGTPKVFFRYFLVNPATGEKSLEMLTNGILGQGPVIQFRLSLSSADSTMGTVSPAGDTMHNENAAVTITATPAQNFAFLRWSDGNTTNPRTVTMDCNLELQAQFVRDMHYTIRVHQTPTAGGTVSGSGSYAEGTTATLSAVPAGGYHFGGWADDADAPATRQVQVTADAEYTAVFIRDQNTYELNTSVNYDEFGYIDSEYGDGTYDAGEEVVLEAIPNDPDEFHFTRWSDGSTQNPRTVVMDRDRTLKAIFLSIYEVSIDPEIVPEGRGEVQGVGYYHIGDTVRLTAVPANGWEFVGWSDDPTAPAVREFMAMEDFYAQAIFQSVNLCAIRGVADVEDTGTVTGGGNYHIGESVTLTAVPAEGYRFAGWLDDPTAPAGRTVVADGDETYWAVFEPVE